MPKMRVQVLGISTGLDIATQEPFAQITFGTTVDVTEEMRKSLPEAQRASVPPKAGVIKMVLFLPATRIIPYRVGTSWDIDVDDEGKLTLTEVK
jgi:hypothetical protein